MIKAGTIITAITANTALSEAILKYTVIEFRMTFRSNINRAAMGLTCPAAVTTVWMWCFADFTVTAVTTGRRAINEPRISDYR